RRRVRERAELLEPLAARTPAELLDDLSADAGAARRWIDRQRPHFGHRRAERRKVGAPDNLLPPDRDRESLGVDHEVAQGPRKQVAFLEVGADQRVKLFGAGSVAGLESDAGAWHL